MKGHEQKKCFHCGSPITKKTGFRNGKQKYKCHVCGRQFVGGERLDAKSLWTEYVQGKQTLSQLAVSHGCSERTVRRKLDSVEVVPTLPGPRTVVVLMDTTYWGSNCGVMLFKDALTGDNLLWYHVRHETNALYVKGVDELMGRGFSVAGIVCDGRKGLIQSFPGIPVQMCQFHQVAILRRYLTKSPKTPAAVELKEIGALMRDTDRESFEGALGDWLHRWGGFMNERSTNPLNGKTFYTHKRLRSAYRSLISNGQWLFTWYGHMGLGIPNTTNAVDGHFADLKNKLRNHNGLSKARRRKFIDEFFKA